MNAAGGHTNTSHSLVFTPGALSSFAAAPTSAASVLASSIVFGFNFQFPAMTAVRLFTGSFPPAFTGSGCSIATARSSLATASAFTSVVVAVRSSSFRPFVWSLAPPRPPKPKMAARTGVGVPRPRPRFPRRPFRDDRATMHFATNVVLCVVVTIIVRPSVVRTYVRTASRNASASEMCRHFTKIHENRPNGFNTRHCAISAQMFDF